MKTRVLIMRPDLPHESMEIEIPDDSYEALRAFVEPIVGGDMEHVNVFADFKGGNNYRYSDMFVNEIGKWKRLPRNEAATIIYRRNTLYHEPGKYEPEDLDEIVGPAVLFEERVWK